MKKPRIRRCNSKGDCDKKNPGVKETLPIGYDKKICQKCINKEKIKDNKRCRDRRMEVVKVTQKYVDAGKYLCHTCAKKGNINNEEDIKKWVHDKKDMGTTQRKNKYGNYIASKCKKCFEREREIEKKRKPRKRSSLEYDRSEHGKNVRKNWKKSNPDLQYKYSTIYRRNKLEKNPIEFRKKNAELHKKWVHSNPEKIKLSIKKTKISIKSNFTRVKNDALKRGYDFNLTIEQFEMYVKNNCFYCCSKPDLENEIYGLDRKDNNIGYNINNVVTSCVTCNMMKNTLNAETFILICIHIFMYIDKNNYDNRYSYVINDYISSDYSHYKNRAFKKNFFFKISKEDYKIFCEEDCYICGKPSSETHKNGIDRFDNNIGYELENCRPCCTTCNLLKKNLDHNFFLEKCEQIFFAHYKKIKKIEKDWKKSYYITKNNIKPSKEEYNEIRKKKKEEREKKTLETKSEDNIKKRQKEIREIHGIASNVE